MKTMIDSDHRIFLGMGTRSELEAFAKETGKNPELILVLDRGNTSLYHTVFTEFGSRVIFIVEDEGGEKEGYRDIDWSIIENIRSEYARHGYKTAYLRGEEKAEERGYGKGTITFGESGENIALNYAKMFGKEYAIEDATRCIPSLD